MRILILVSAFMNIWLIAWKKWQSGYNNRQYLNLFQIFAIRNMIGDWWLRRCFRKPSTINCWINLKYKIKYRSGIQMYSSINIDNNNLYIACHLVGISFEERAHFKLILLDLQFIRIEFILFQVSAMICCCHWFLANCIYSLILLFRWLWMRKKLEKKKLECKGNEMNPKKSSYSTHTHTALYTNANRIRYCLFSHEFASVFHSLFTCRETHDAYTRFAKFNVIQQ